MNARKLALALQYARDRYATSSGDNSVFLVPAGTVVSDNAETTDPNAEYTDDDNVRMTYPDGSVYVLHIERIG